MNRRRVISIGAGIAAGLAGVGVATWWPTREMVDDALWSLDLPRPGGGRVAFAALRGKPLLVNFWATWCVPCIAEMPLLERFHEARAAAGWQVVGVAIDQERAVTEFVAAKGIRFPVAIAGPGTLDVARTLGNTAGGLPFSVAVAADGRVLGRRLGAVDEHLLAEWVASAR